MGLKELAAAAECGDAAVQAKAAKIQASVVTTMSVLSAISTGFWSRRGDVQGRKLILATFFIGAILMEAVFVLVMRPQSIFGRYGEKFILVGPIIEGFVGGLSTFNGVVHAYVSDCTRHGSRSKIFATIQGMVFVGLATGPQFAGFFLPKIGYSDSFFYSSIALILAVLLYVVFICPESLPPKSRNELVEESTPELVQVKTSPVVAASEIIGRFIKSVLSPVLMFAPRRLPGTRKLQYSMPLVGMALFVYLVSTGVYSAKYLYAQHVFSWNTAELGYYMSILWITRAFNLLVFLPIVLSYLKPKPTTPPGSSPNAHDIAAEIRFDRYLAQISVGVDGLADALVALTASSSEVGTLFGAMGVLSAVAHIISPSIYALTYSRSVASFPEAIFVLAASLLFSGVLLLSRVRPVESDIAEIHGVNNLSSESERNRRMSVSYDYDAIPTFDRRNDSDSDEEVHESDDERWPREPNRVLICSLLSIICALIPIFLALHSQPSSQATNLHPSVTTLLYDLGLRLS
ncbi:hypothetical protein MD484_g5221, partial [Candolleomyces efflorescens]